MDWSKVKYFRKSEFECSCGCGESPMNEEFIKLLDELREEFKSPIYITSGYRCPAHNKKIGGVSDSYHTKGVAVDIHIYGVNAYNLLKLALSKFDGIGISQKGGVGSRFIHLDKGTLTDGTKNRPAVWSY